MYEQRRLEELIENEWLGLGDTTSIVTDNPLERRLPEDIERPDLHILGLMRRPEYFSFTCKHVFNKIITPMQQAVLYELWHRPFPMLIGARGFSKSWMLATYILLRLMLNPGTKVVVVGAAFRQAKVVFEYCEEIWNNAPVFRDICGGNSRNGPRRDIDRCTFRAGDSISIFIPLGDGGKIRGQRASIIVAEEFACLEKNTLVETDRGLMRIGDSEQKLGSFNLITNDGTEAPAAFVKTPPCDAYRVTTRGGYNFVCSDIHQVHTTKGWKLAKDLTSNDYLTFENRYQFPTDQVVQDDLVVDDQLGWLMGILIAEGSINDKHGFQVHMTDPECVDRVRSSLQSYMPDRHVGVCEKDAYIDKRGWVCKHSYTAYCCNVKFRNKLVALGLSRERALQKSTPWSILQSPKSVVVAYLKGLFEGDGSAFIWRDRDKPKLGVAYYSSSWQLINEVQVLLQKLNIYSSMQPRKNPISVNVQWILRLNGEHAYALCRLLDIRKWRAIVEQVPEPILIKNKPVWDKSRNRWKAEIWIEGKMKYLGSFPTYDEAWAKVEASRPVPYLRVKKVEKLPEKQVLYDYHLPRTHAFYGNCFQQHNTIPVEIFENVVSGFASVSLSPVEKMRSMARMRAMRRLGVVLPGEMQDETVVGMNSNQTIVSGTAYYGFNHFYSYWSRYKKIIETRGDRKKLEELFQGEIPEKFDWRDYSIVRIPVELIPEGFMDERHVSKAKATIHRNQFSMEYGACFAADSDGFFKRSLIESCVVGKEDKPITHPSCGEVLFHAMLRGDPTKHYVMAVDPASENDNLSIVLLECWPEHRRIVYCWTTNRKGHKTKLQKKLTEDQDYYGYVAKKIRELLALFRCERVALDSQGGGVAVLEALGNQATLRDGELAILPIIDPEEPRDTDRKEGLHLIELINFARAEWVAEANHGLRFDFESKTLLFPQYDSVILGTAIEQDKITGRVKADKNEIEALYDTLENCFLEIEELKDELATIVHTQSGATLRDRWDTPEVKMAGGKKGRLRKDRYSSLLMANMVARQLARVATHVDYQIYGGFATDLVKQKERSRPNRKHRNPDWYERATGRNYGAMVGRRGIS